MSMTSMPCTLVSAIAVRSRLRPEALEAEAGGAVEARKRHAGGPPRGLAEYNVALAGVVVANPGTDDDVVESVAVDVPGGQRHRMKAVQDDRRAEAAVSRHRHQRHRSVAGHEDVRHAVQVHDLHQRPRALVVL
jgi:hypothetical protein